MRFAVFSLFCVVGVAHALDPVDIQIGSQAELWRQKTSQEKLAYIEGMCEGLQAYGDESKLAAPSCRDDVPLQQRKVRFCGLYINREPEKVQHFDTFYKVSGHSDVPNWAAIAAYNDKVCGENSATSRIPKLQARLKCNRTLANMSMSVTKEAYAKQKEYCDTLPWR